MVVECRRKTRFENNYSSAPEKPDSPAKNECVQLISNKTNLACNSFRPLKKVTVTSTVAREKKPGDRCLGLQRRRNVNGASGRPNALRCAYPVRRSFFGPQDEEHAAKPMDTPAMTMILIIIIIITVADHDEHDELGAPACWRHWADKFVASILMTMSIMGGLPPYPNKRITGLRISGRCVGEPSQLFTLHNTISWARQWDNWSGFFSLQVPTESVFLMSWNKSLDYHPFVNCLTFRITIHLIHFTFHFSFACLVA